MKKFILAGWVMLFFFQSALAQKTNRVVKDPILHREVLVGNCNRHGLETGLFSTWFNSQYKNYQPEAALVKEIARKMHSTHITIVFGSWCGDSKMQVGRFYKILDEAGYTKKPKVIAVTRSLKAGDVDISGLHIRRIPTFIVYRNGKEIGRIVESPKKSLEADLLQILKK
jgi:hypothetical protein